MNDKLILFHLKEAKEELDRMIHEREAGDSGSLVVEMQHLYHHLNTAWNGRNYEGDDYGSDEDFDRWRQFPEDLQMDGPNIHLLS